MYKFLIALQTILHGNILRVNADWQMASATFGGMLLLHEN